MLSGLFAFMERMAILIANIDDYLDRVLPLLAELAEQDRPDWTAQQAVEMCRTGQWLLIVADDDTGFGMCSVRSSMFSGKSQLVIEAVVMPPGSKGTDYYDGFWDLLARRLMCDEIVMESRRRGWERKGWLPGWTSYSRPVREVDYAVVS